MTKEVSFSQVQMDYIMDTDFLLSKLEISKKVELLLGEVEQSLHAIISDFAWPDGVLVRSGKISKGENYLGLPYHLLDFPRRFDKQNVFAFRTMFWWGNFFSATLHLGGDYLDQVRSELIYNCEKLIKSEAFICVNNNPWVYHYDADNYVPLSQINVDELRQMLDARPFQKISYKWNLEQYQQLSKLVQNAFKETLTFISR